MRIHKKVHSHDSGLWILCAWADCERPGFELYKMRLHDGQNIVQFVFCSERHKMLYVNSHRNYGRLPAGYRYVS